MAGSIRRLRKVPTLSLRARSAHKGDFGRVLVVGGSRGMIGAPALAANAALRGGAGLCTVAAPETVQLAVATLCPCATSIPLDCDGQGVPAATAARQVLASAAKADVLAVGPGMDRGEPQKTLLRALLEQTRPIVLDADGLNNLADIDGWPERRRCGLVLTPHPGEFARLTRRDVAGVQAAREAAAVAAARQWIDVRAENMPPLVVVLKGAGTVVTDGRQVYVNATGNPGMATGGSGDVLTGLLGALIAQGLGLFDAACLAVRAHGKAGDLAAARLGETSLIATDLLDFLPAALQRHAPTRKKRK
ncbi:MAG TPA: NAD(P)H-hydrate dehydratase [Phycisphaerae bacterium]|nr:NAD(P)H-hydrate dehydratase [Phycisphaerae bacterium]